MRIRSHSLTATAVALASVAAWSLVPACSSKHDRAADSTQDPLSTGQLQMALSARLAAWQAVQPREEAHAQAARPETDRRRGITAGLAVTAGLCRRRRITAG